MLDRLIDLILSILHLFQVWTVVEPWQQALVTRLGKITRTLGPGFHWVLPFHLHRVYHVNVVPVPTTLAPQSIETADGKQVVVRPVALWGVNDVRTFLTKTENADTLLSEVIGPLVTRKAKDATLEELKSDRFLSDTRRYVREHMRKYGMELVDLGFKDLTRSRSIRLWQDTTHAMADYQ
jgi:membrane protease subunit HflK